MGAYVECELAGDHPNNDACAFESPPCPPAVASLRAGQVGPGPIKISVARPKKFVFLFFVREKLVGLLVSVVS